MRRHSVRTMSNNYFGYMYINLFQKRHLANGLTRKTKDSCTELLPPQGFRPEGEIPRRHSSNSACNKESTYS